MKPIRTAYEDFDFKSVAARDRKRAEKQKQDLSIQFGLALGDKKNTVYFYKTKARRHRVYLALRKFYPDIEKLPDKTTEKDLL